MLSSEQMEEENQIKHKEELERKERKGTVFIQRLYTTHSLKALRHGSHSFNCKLHHACLSFISVHQMVPPLTEVADIELQLTTHLSTQKGWEAELALLADLQQMVYPHKWSPVSYRLTAGQGKFAG